MQRAPNLPTTRKQNMLPEPIEQPEEAPEQPRPKVKWPVPSEMNFSLADRRDPFNLSYRHDSLHRRSTDRDDD